MYHRVLAYDRFSHYYMNLFDHSNAFFTYRWGTLALRAVPISPFKTPGNSKGTVFGGPICSPTSRIRREQFHEKRDVNRYGPFCSVSPFKNSNTHLKVPSRMEHFVPSPFTVLNEQFESQVRVHFLLFSPREHSVRNKRVYWGV